MVPQVPQRIFDVVVGSGLVFIGLFILLLSFCTLQSKSKRFCRLIRLIGASELICGILAIGEWGKAHGGYLSFIPYALIFLSSVLLPFYIVIDEIKNEGEEDRAGDKRGEDGAF